MVCIVVVEHSAASSPQATPRPHSLRSTLSICFALVRILVEKVGEELSLPSGKHVSSIVFGGECVGVHLNSVLYAIPASEDQLLTKSQSKLRTWTFDVILVYSKDKARRPRTKNIS